MIRIEYLILNYLYDNHCLLPSAVNRWQQFGPSHTSPYLYQNTKFLSRLFSHTSAHLRPYPLSSDILPQNRGGGGADTALAAWLETSRIDSLYLKLPTEYSLLS